jgi:hypothetical protein
MFSVKNMAVAPAIKRKSPQYSMGLRPVLSDKGPQSNCPKANPAKNTEIEIWICPISVWKICAILGKAGRYRSILSDSRVLSSARINTTILKFLIKGFNHSTIYTDRFFSWQNSGKKHSFSIQ